MPAWQHLVVHFALHSLVFNHATTKWMPGSNDSLYSYQKCMPHRTCACMAVVVLPLRVLLPAFDWYSTVWNSGTCACLPGCGRLLRLACAFVCAVLAAGLYTKNGHVRPRACNRRPLLPWASALAGCAHARAVREGVPPGACIDAFCVLPRRHHVNGKVRLPRLALVLHVVLPISIGNGLPECCSAQCRKSHWVRITAAPPA